MSIATTGKGYLIMSEIELKPCPFCDGVKREAAIGYTPDSDVCRRIDEPIGIKCPNCGRQIDPHAGHINNGRVFVCEKGKPLMLEVKYRCGNCNSTIIFLKKCEPKGVDHD